MHRALRAVLLATAASFATVSAAGAGTAPPGSEPASSEVASAWIVTIDGAVAEPVELTADDLAAFEQHEQTVTFESGSGFQTRVFEGPLLIDVLEAASPVFDDEVKNDKLGHAIVFTATDGYVAAVAWGEVDADFEAKPMLLALAQDGEPLTDGPRLTAPGDGHGGRYVSSVVTITIVGPS